MQGSYPSPQPLRDGFCWENRNKKGGSRQNLFSLRLSKICYAIHYD